ncbi:MAG: 3-isopropylmalate dehydratase small subunit [bacterium]|nr:3-isopropylmalate dehydratase small subunit [bacterium]MXX64953.1 3-isopropylmalate dehydratase small subunit [Acidimicrobiia bacterium]MCY3579381.1 3-isopropylmalate dehydratase small subunit [bacterium]MCY3652332.1 3-isopropylmalate dehydratase small subunit [bacterium]MDE0642576.1 3-isopropylmalate dehydratase small subunit [bacterium]
MDRVTTIAGSMMPLPRSNCDTDQIMPKQFLKRVERSGYGQFLFYDWARTPDRKLDPDFVLNRPEYQQAKVLVTGPNFGSGSSREHAPWGIQDWGFEAVIAPSFADIFYNNCTKIGLLPIILGESEVGHLMDLAERSPDADITINLSEQTVVAPGWSARFEIDPFTKYRLLEGLDDIGLTLRNLAAIDSFEESRPGHLPSLA